MFPRNYILFFASNLQMRNQISFEDFLSKVFAWLWMTCFQIARPEWVTVWASYLLEFVWVMTSRGGPAAASLSLAMIITAAAWSLIIVFIHLLFHGSKITIYFDEDDQVRKNSSIICNQIETACNGGDDQTCWTGATCRDVNGQFHCRQ